MTCMPSLFDHPSVPLLLSTKTRLEPSLSTKTAPTPMADVELANLVTAFICVAMQMDYLVGMYPKERWAQNFHY